MTERHPGAADDASLVRELAAGIRGGPGHALRPIRRRDLRGGVPADVRSRGGRGGRAGDVPHLVESRRAVRSGRRIAERLAAHDRAQPGGGPAASRRSPPATRDAVVLVGNPDESETQALERASPAVRSWPARGNRPGPRRRRPPRTSGTRSAARSRPCRRSSERSSCWRTRRSCRRPRSPIGWPGHSARSRRGLVGRCCACARRSVAEFGPSPELDAVPVPTGKDR